jgi:hypothetical protein
MALSHFFKQDDKNFLRVLIIVCGSVVTLFLLQFLQKGDNYEETLFTNPSFADLVSLFVWLQ